MASTAYNSRELAYLQKAQTVLKLDPACRTGEAINENVATCAAIASDSMLKFRAAWNAQMDSFKDSYGSLKTIRRICGDLDRKDGLTTVGVIPALALVGCTVGIAVVVVAYLQRKGMGTPERFSFAKDTGIPYDLANTLATACVVVIVVVIVLAVSWSYGIMTKHEAWAYQNLILNDPDAASTDATSLDTKLFNNPAFGVIWQACNSNALRQIYNCSNALAANTALPNTDDPSAEGASCASGLPTQLSNDVDVLRQGLSQLVATNLDDFDATVLKRRIGAGIAKLKRWLSPQVAERSVMSATDLLDVVRKTIMPVIKSPDYKPASDDERQTKQAVFVNAMESTIIPELTSVVSEYWPQLDLEMHMSIVDDELASYYAYPGNNTFYDAYLREFVLASFRVAKQSASVALSSDDGRFVTTQQFVRVNWSKVVAQSQIVRVNVLHLFTDISRYTETFVSNFKTATTVGSDLLQMYTKCAYVIIAFSLVLFLIKFVWIKQGNTLKDAVTVHGNASGWYAKLDVLKYLLAAVAVCMLVVTILNVLNSNVQSRTAHNHEALYQNSMRLKAAAWTLATTINPLNCQMAERYQTVDPIAYQACIKGGKDYAMLSAVAGASAFQTKAIVIADTTTALAFYNAAVTVISAYESCNLIAQSSTVPFPTAEFVLLAVCLAVCIGGIVFMYMVAEPRKQIVEIRDLLRFRELLKTMTIGIPPAIAAELDNRLMCVRSNADVFRILSFCIVLVLFILNAFLVQNFGRSSKAYRNALDTYSANACV
jgi:hypothetical protein